MKKNENNENYIFADNILHPLNEFLNITVDFGFIGLGILILSIIFIIYINYHNRNEDICLGIQILVCIGILSMFSYPFDYPFSWLMLVFSLIIILKRFILSHSHLIGLILLCFLPIYGYSFFNKLSYILEYKQLYNKASYGMFDQVRYRYEQLYPYLKNDPRFLYNYASELNEIGEYEKALSVAIECRKILADYDLCLLIGGIAYNLNYLSIALENYQKAHYMCPNRFIPLDRQLKVLIHQRKQKQAIAKAEEIINKRIKIPSLQIDNIKEKAQQYINKKKYNSSFQE